MEIKLQEVKSNLTKLIHQAANGEEIIIIEDQQPIAKIVGIKKEKNSSGFGSAKEQILYIADDFDSTPEEFKEYTQ